MTADPSDAWDEAVHGESYSMPVPGGRKHIAIDVGRVLVKLQDLADKIDDAAALLRDADARATDAKWAYEKAYAHAIIRFADSKNSELRQALARRETLGAYEELLVAERVVRTTREMLYAYREQVRAYQSISVLVREQGG
jgi:hypothetical protein